jgi:hypothetical protein
MIVLKKTAPGCREPGSGKSKARRALISTENITHSPNKYNLENLLPVATASYTKEDINRVKNAVISYCLAMTDGDTTTMATAAGILQSLARIP